MKGEKIQYRQLYRKDATTIDFRKTKREFEEFNIYSGSHVW